jgi:DNA-binding transcriptional LysR family regulator
MREPGSGTRMVAERHFAGVGFAPRIAMSLGSNEAIKHAVAAGLGIAIVSRLAVESSQPVRRPGGAGIAILDVGGFPLRRTWSIVWRKDRPPAFAARKFVEYVKAGRGALR